MKLTRSFCAIACAAATLAACSDSSGPGNGDARVYITSTAAVAGQTAPTAFMGSVPLSAVDSINITLTSIQATNANDSSGAVTISLQGAGARSINLFKLSTLGTDSTLIGRSTLPAGTYDGIRLRFSAATISLKQTVVVGQVTFVPGTYDLTIPSGLSSGIKVQGGTFTVSADASTSATLSFDPATTVGTIVATGSNKLMMSPVLHVRTTVK